MKIAFQGEPGAYSEAACIAFYGEDITTVPCASFEEVFQAVEDGLADRAMVPVENSLAGSIHRNYDLLLRHKLHIVGEYALRVRHHLMALPGVPLSQIQRVLSHPQALAQCEHYLDKLGAERIATYDTAGSAKKLQEEQITNAAAIASARAANVWKLHVLDDEIEDTPENYTRFLALSQTPTEIPEDVPAKTSIVFSLKDAPGVLFKALSVFALRDIDLVKIESRPLRERPWRYLFYVDFTERQDTIAAQNALRHLREVAPFLRVLGTYRARTGDTNLA